MKIEAKKPTEISNFDLLSLKILSKMALEDRIDDESIDLLREMQMEHYTLLKKYEILEERVNIDTKTSLLKYNEGLLVNIVKTISRYWHSSRESNILPISYLRLDLDDFHKVNNIYGHAIGDRVLVAVAKVMKRTSRPTDFIFRFGGEEFDIILPVTDRAGAESYANKLLQGIRKIRIPVGNGRKIKITGSIGASILEFNYKTTVPMVAKEIIKKYHKVQKEADYACYQAKSLGKDRYCFYQPDINYKKILKEYGSQH